MGSLTKMLMKVALQVLQSQVIAVVNAQMNLVDQQVRSLMQRYVQEVMQGMWRGDGANRFIEEIAQDAIPSVTRMTEVVRTTNRNIEVSRDTLKDADTRVKTAIGRIHDAFQQI